MSNYKLLINTSHKPNKEQTNLEGPKKKERILPTNLAHQSFQSRPETTPISKSSGPLVIRAKRKLQAERRSALVVKRCNNGRPINRPAPRRYQKNSISDDVIVWRRIIDLNPPKKSGNTYIRIYIYTCRNNGSIAETIFADQMSFRWIVPECLIRYEFSRGSVTSLFLFIPYFSNFSPSFLFYFIFFYLFVLCYPLKIYITFCSYTNLL